MVQKIYPRGVIWGPCFPHPVDIFFKKNQLSVLSIYIVVLGQAAQFVHNTGSTNSDFKADDYSEFDEPKTKNLDIQVTAVIIFSCRICIFIYLYLGKFTQVSITKSTEIKMTASFKTQLDWIQYTFKVDICTKMERILYVRTLSLPIKKSIERSHGQTVC